MLKFFTVLTFAVLTLGIFGCGGALPGCGWKGAGHGGISARLLR